MALKHTQTGTYTHQAIIALQNYLHNLSLNICLQKDLQELLFSTALDQGILEGNIWPKHLNLTHAAPLK